MANAIFYNFVNCTWKQKFYKGKSDVHEQSKNLLVTGIASLDRLQNIFGYWWFCEFCTSTSNHVKYFEFQRKNL